MLINTRQVQRRRVFFAQDFLQESLVRHEYISDSSLGLS